MGVFGAAAHKPVIHNAVLVLETGFGVYRHDQLKLFGVL